MHLRTRQWPYQALTAHIFCLLGALFGLTGPAMAQQLPYGMALQPGLMMQPGMIQPGMLPQAGLPMLPGQPGQGLAAGSLAIPGLVGAPGTANRLGCPPGTQGISCWEQNAPVLFARPGASVLGAGHAGTSELQRGLAQRSAWDEPTQFQRHVERLTGRWLPIYGLSFFNDAILMRSDGLRTQGPEFANPSDYVLGVGDEIQLNVWGQVESALTLLIDTQGQVTLPKVGPVTVAGLRLTQLEPFLHQQYAKSFSNFKLSVRAGALRSLQVYVVGHARQPGAYVLSGQATLLAAVQMAGGPSPTGSMRSITLMRAGKPVGSMDLYRLIAKGDATSNLRLMPGDTVLIPPAGPRVALTGQTDQAGIFELLAGEDKLASLFQTAGVSLSLTEKSVLLERFTQRSTATPQADALRVDALRLDESALQSTLNDGDIITLQRKPSGFSNAITLRGHVARPLRHAWRAGMTVRDLLPDVAALITPDYHERRNALVQYEGAIAASRWIKIPQPAPSSDGKSQTVQPMQSLAGQSGFGTESRASAEARMLLEGAGSFTGPGAQGVANNIPSQPITMRREAIPGTPYGIDPYRRLPGERPPTDVRQLLDEIHWDYAVIERLNPKDLSLQLLPFHLGRLLLQGDMSQNHALEPGDIVTIFGKSDLRIPQQRQQRLVRVEGEVQSPGYYLAADEDNLQTMLQKAGGLTPRAYVFGLRFTRESVRKEQKENLARLIKNLQDTQANVLAQAMTSVRGADGNVSSQAVDSVQQIRIQQQRVLERLVKLEPEGRIALGLSPNDTGLATLPALPMEAADSIVVPSIPSFVSVQGATLSENALLWRPGQTAAELIRVSGTPSYADIDHAFVLRADGSTASFLSNDPRKLYLMPGDTLVIPELADRRTNFWKGMDLARSWASLFSQIGISLVAIKTLFNN